MTKPIIQWTSPKICADIEPVSVLLQEAIVESVAVTVFGMGRS
jgi:hypothetical protein